VVFGSLVSQATAMPGVLRHVEPRLLLPFIAGAIFGLPIGTLLIGWVDLALFRLSVGLLLIVFATFQLLIGPRLRPLQSDRLAAETGIGWISGILGGLAGLSGVVPAMWSVVRGWSKERQRGVFLVFNSFCHVVALTGLVIAGYITATTLLRFAILLPALVAGAWLGTLAYGRISPLQFRRVVLLLLAASGIALTVQNGWRALTG
jgi:uncharacterized membrane protein YfcA